MIKKCIRCGCKFQTRKPKPFCPVCRDKELQEVRRELDRLKHKRRQILQQQRVDASIGKPTKTLAEWLREAAECNLDYGTYRTLVEIQGKTLDELKAQHRHTSAHAHGHHRSKSDD